MKRFFRSLLIPACLMSAVFSGCTQQLHLPQPPGNTIINVAYVVKDPQLKQNSVLSTETRKVWKAPNEELVKQIFDYMKTPSSSKLASAIPEGTAIVKVTVASNTVTLNLSSEYGKLTGIQRSIADAAIVYSLTEVEEFDFVKIMVHGQELNDARNTFLDRKAILTNDEKLPEVDN